MYYPDHEFNIILTPQAWGMLCEISVGKTWVKTFCFSCSGHPCSRRKSSDRNTCGEVREEKQKLLLQGKATPACVLVQENSGTSGLFIKNKERFRIRK